MSKRAACYVRLSRYRGAEVDPSTSPERQEESTTSYAKAKGWEVVRVIRDLDVSGSEKGLRLERPGIQEIRALWGLIDVVIVPKLDRLARSVVDFHLFAQEAREHGVDLVSVHEGLDLTTPSGRFVATILAAFAEMEAATISERTKAGHREAKRQGRWTGGVPPYGYRATPSPEGPWTVLEPEPGEAEAIRAVVDLILSGTSLTKATQWMNEHGPTPRRAPYWSRRVLRQVLMGDAILGRLRAEGRPLRGEDGHALEFFPAIVTLEEAEAVRAALEPQEAVLKGRPRARLLSGLISCHSCGSKLRVARRHDTPTYRCQARGEGMPCEAPVGVVAQYVEDYVEGRYLGAFGAMPMVEHRIVEANPVGLVAVEDAIRAALADLATAATPEAFARLQALQEERERLSSEPRIRTEEMVETGRTVAEEWEARDIEGRRALLEGAIGLLVLHPGERHGRRVFNPARVLLVWAN